VCWPGYVFDLSTPERPLSLCSCAQNSCRTLAASRSTDFQKPQLLGIAVDCVEYTYFIASLRAHHVNAATPLRILPVHFEKRKLQNDIFRVSIAINCYGKANRGNDGEMAPGLERPVVS
jgi:hypothetical protein